MEGIYRRMLYIYRYIEGCYTDLRYPYVDEAREASGSIERDFSCLKPTQSLSEPKKKKKEEKNQEKM